MVRVYSGVEELRVGGFEPLATRFLFPLPLPLLSSLSLALWHFLALSSLRKQQAEEKLTQVLLAVAANKIIIIRHRFGSVWT